MAWSVEAVLEDDSIDIAELNTGFLLMPVLVGDLGDCILAGTDSDKVRLKSHCCETRIH